jgi:tetratricopeptide (TPR) repeat protein
MAHRTVTAILILITPLILPLPVRAQQKPFTQEQVSNMVRDGFGDESGAKLIEQRRIDFAPSEDFCQSLKAAGANETFLKALRAAKPPEPASAKKPMNADDYYNSGNAKEAIGDLDGSIADYTKAIELKADFPGAYYNRGNVKQAKGDLDGAIADFSKAIELKPDLAAAYNNRGYVKKAKGDLDGSIADYTKAIELKPDSALAYYNRGDAKQAKGDMDGANADHTKATEIDSRLDRTSPQTSTNLLAHTGTGPKIGGPQPAGGKWTYDIGEDKLTGALFGVFSLEGDEPITDGVASALPSFVIMCGGPLDSPHWLNSKLLSPVVLRMPDTKSPFGAPQQTVYLRADSKVRLHFWNMAEDFRTFFVDKGATKELLNSRIARIQFRDSSGHTQVAIFSPSGLDREGLVKACGSVLK